MENFDLETRRKKLYNGLRNKWRQKSREYTEKIEQMKIKSEKLFKERSRQYKQKIKKRDLLIKSRQELNNQL